MKERFDNFVFKKSRNNTCPFLGSKTCEAEFLIRTNILQKTGTARTSKVR
jgi:hypothetical protein